MYNASRSIFPTTISVNFKKVQWIVSNPFSLSANRTQVYFETGWAYKVLTKTNFMCLGLIYAHKKENLKKVTLKASKGHICIFAPKESTFDPYL